MDRNEYRPRIIDPILERYLSAFGAVYIEGAKDIGKTWTGEFHSKSTYFIADPQGNYRNREYARMDPSLILPGERPRLFDEWQDVPSIWDAVRFEVDKTHSCGQFILTGSATPNWNKISHSGTGRIATLRMRPMSLYEMGYSSGAVSLEKLCKGELKDQMLESVRLERLADYILRGGWPGNMGKSIEDAMLLPKDYVRTVLNRDIFNVDDVHRDKNLMGLLMKSLARNESSTATLKTFQNDIKISGDRDVTTDTVSSYLDVLNKLLLIDNQLPFASRLRSSVRVRRQVKRHFVDPSLSAALLDATPESLIQDLETFGLLFEALCVRDLRIYAEAFGAELYHYLDYRNREMDAVVSLPGGEWCGFEIKLGANRIDEGAENLLKIKKEIEKENDEKGPKILCVICGLEGAAYRRPDGVYVVPLTALKP